MKIYVSGNRNHGQDCTCTPSELTRLLQQKELIINGNFHIQQTKKDISWVSMK